MLARANRIVRGDDYRAIVRRGRRVATDNAVIYRLSGSSAEVRFGFIVAKSVGNAVVRNRVRRRLKSIGHAHLEALPDKTDIVIRALPGSASASWSTLNSEIHEALSKGMARS